MTMPVATFDSDASARLLRALAHSVRLNLLRTLAAGERSVSDIEAATGVGQPGLSQQLAVLRKAELVETRRDAKLVFYRIKRERFAELGLLLDAFAGTAAPARDVPDPAAQARGGAATFARMG